MPPMAKKISYALLSMRAMLVSAGPFILLTVVLLTLAYWWLDPNPPKHVTLATGPAQSAYAEFGTRYAKALALNGIEVRLVPSEGSSANLQLLREGKVDLGFVQGGSDENPLNAESGIESLGSLFVEPLWLFYKTQAAIDATTNDTLTSFGQLKTLRINVGTKGSGVPALMEKLFDVNRLELATLKLSKLEQTPATMAFLNNEVDAIVFASAPESPMVQMLLQTQIGRASCRERV